MTDLTSLTLAQARDGLRNKDFTAIELAKAHLSAVEQARRLNAFVLETPDRARHMARAADARLAKGEGGPLEGLPLGIKDLFCTAEVRTTACSHILENFIPAYEFMSPPICGATARCYLASSTMTNSPWARRMRLLVSDRSCRRGDGAAQR